MLKKLVPFFFLAASLIGCNNQAEEEQIAFPAAVFTISPDTSKINEPITFEVKITAGDQAVEDADVKLEFWQDGQEDSEHIMIPIEHTSDGSYTLEKSFESPGTYFVYYHADAMSMHMMEKSSFTITE
ncbi:FixH family protein [Bacillus sp. Marseille-P3661]|uniref:FixH family protein n=1 Tax=Bacillus sp. Marseille-P3661 TaxID=1936234 RepID=UPI000C84868E|nr:FixH family protein [Bacillus sp. Marseille-P3661]